MQDLTPGTKLYDRLVLMGISLNQVRSSVGINRSCMNDYLNRRRHISPGHLVRLCRLLHCEPETIYE